MNKKELEQNIISLNHRLNRIQQEIHAQDKLIQELQTFKWSIENPCKYKIGDKIEDCLIINIVPEKFNYSDNTYSITFFKDNKTTKMYLEDFEQYIKPKIVNCD